MWLRRVHLQYWLNARWLFWNLLHLSQCHLLWIRNHFFIRRQHSFALDWTLKTGLFLLLRELHKRRWAQNFVLGLGLLSGSGFILSCVFGRLFKKTCKMGVVLESLLNLFRFLFLLELLQPFNSVVLRIAALVARRWGFLAKWWLHSSNEKDQFWKVRSFSQAYQFEIKSKS